MIQKPRFQTTRTHACQLVLWSVLGLLSAAAVMAETVPVSSNSGDDEQTFIFMGRCDNGEMYRLKAYQKLMESVSFSFYDYEGPAGKGTIQSQITPKTLAVRVCRALAEIRSDI